MEIGGFKVGPWSVREEAEKRYLIFDCRNCIYSRSISDDKACRYHVLKVLSEVQADLIVLAEVYERIYNEEQTKMLIEISALAQKFALESIWSYSNLGDITTKADEENFPLRYKQIVKIAQELIWYDPIDAYLNCVQEIKKEEQRYEKGTDIYKKGSAIYLKTLNYARNEFEKTTLIKRAKTFLMRLKEFPETEEIYRSFFIAEIKPSFIGARLMFEESEELELLDEYLVNKTQIQIFKHPNLTQNLYFVNPSEYSLTPEKYFVLSKTKEIVAGYEPGKASLSTVARTRDYFERVYQSTIYDIAEANQIKLTKDEVKELSEVVARYTVGYGILETILSDRKVTDVYIDSPIGQNPIYLVHSEYGQCRTNILYTDREAQAVITKMRAMSARPFDEAHPVLDYDLPNLDTRVAVIGPPLAPDGVAFAFRLHKLTPWTLPQFLDVKFLNSTAAGMLSFFIDNQSTILIAGSRGSGKTSLMSAAMLEILKSARILVQEDTLELPIPYMKKIGFNVQRLKTRSAISVATSETEIAPEEALRTALRLGDSAIILGEVRSLETKTLYEAMRVGAAGNVVMGTIHADSAYSVWDRVVNDLQVPTTSFKATDLVVVARPIRFSGSLKRARRITQMTEVKKHWTSDPEAEGGLLDLMLYDAKKDDLELLEDNLKESDLFDKIRKTSGLTIEEIWKEINMRGESKAFLVELKNKYKVPDLLEANYTTMASDKLLIIKEKYLEEHGKPDYNAILGEWKNWAKEHLLKRVLVETKKIQ